jgi:RNA-directed DNA polymerase
VTRASVPEYVGVQRERYLRATRAEKWQLLDEVVAVAHIHRKAAIRIVDLTQGEAFGFLGFAFRRLRSPRGRWWVQKTPAIKQRTALLRKLKEVFRRWHSQPVGQVIAVINPILRGWVNYFRVGNAARCFGFVKEWVERKVRRHLMRARSRRGFGWKRWSTARVYTVLGVFNDYRVRYQVRA